MTKLQFSSILLMAVAFIMWMVAVIAQLTNGNPDGWVDAGVIMSIISLIPLLIESKVWESRSR